MKDHIALNKNLYPLTPILITVEAFRDHAAIAINDDEEYYHVDIAYDKDDPHLRHIRGQFVNFLLATMHNGS